jgi:hypothetical protein
LSDGNSPGRSYLLSNYESLFSVRGGMTSLTLLINFS